MARIDTPRRQVRDRRPETDEFYETMAAPMHQVRSPEMSIDDTRSSAERVVSFIAGVLNILLIIRFIAALFSSNANNPVMAVIFNATNWLAAPFQTIFGSPPSGGGGYFDLPALAALVAVSVVAW